MRIVLSLLLDGGERDEGGDTGPRGIGRRVR
jgi:hypothetical protein